MSGSFGRFLTGDNPMSRFDIPEHQVDPRLAEAIHRQMDPGAAKDTAGAAMLRRGLRRSAEQGAGAIRSQRGLSPAVAADLTGRLTQTAGADAADKAAMMMAQEKAAARQQGLGLEDMNRMIWQARLQAGMEKARAGAHGGLLGTLASTAGSFLPFAFMGRGGGGGQQQPQQPPPNDPAFPND